MILNIFVNWFSFFWLWFSKYFKCNVNEALNGRHGWQTDISYTHPLCWQLYPSASCSWGGLLHWIGLMVIQKSYVYANDMYVFCAYVCVCILPKTLIHPWNNLFIFAKFAYESPFYHWWPVMHVSVEKTPTPLLQNDFGKYWRCSIVSLFHDFNVSDIIKNFTSPRRECIPDTT